MNNRYDKYKSVSLPWLNEIPEHWEIIRNKNIFMEKKKSVGSQFEKYKLLSLSLKGVIERNLEDGGKFPASFEKYTIVNPKDLVFCLFDIDETPRTIGISKIEGMITSAYNIMAVKKDCAKYIYYFYLYLDFIKGLKPYYSSLRKTVNIDTFNSFKILIPPINEQEQIANYLDWKINEIDRLIQIEKEKIKELNQIMQIAIDSGYKILDTEDRTDRGTKIKFLANQITQRSSESRRYIALENIISKKGMLNNSFNELEFNRDGILVEKDMVIFGKLRPYLAKAIVIENKAVCSSEFLVLKPHKVLPLYLKYLMLSSKFIDLVYSSTYVTKMPRVNADFILNLQIVVPDLSEQKEIVEKILEHENKINKSIEIILRKIISMEDLKQSLISEVVTGKIDVSNIVIPEYEKVTLLDDDAEGLDEVEGIDNGD